MARAKYIVILGPDGSGKTTVADQLAQDLGLVCKTWRMNFSFCLLPPLSTIMGRPPKKDTPAGQKNAGMIKPLHRSHAILLAIWYGIDHVLGHVTLGLKYRNGTIIFARSYHDFLYQRAYVNLPKFVPFFFLALGPKPNLIAMPVRDPKVIYAEKPELTESEIIDQYTRLSNGLRQFPQFSHINASCGIRDVVQQIRTKMCL